MNLYLMGSQCSDFRSGITWQYLLSSNKRRGPHFVPAATYVGGSWAHHTVDYYNNQFC